MGVWPSELTVITNKGLELIAKTPTGASYTLCRAIAGRGKIAPDPDSADPIGNIAEKLTELTDVCEPFLYGVATAEYLGNKRARITSMFSNALLKEGEGADCNMVGVTAIDPNEGEILFMVKQASVKDDIPSRNVMPLSITHKDVVFLGNAKEIKYDPPDSLLVYQAEFKPVKEMAAEAQMISQAAAQQIQTFGKIHFTPGRPESLKPGDLWLKCGELRLVEDDGGEPQIITIKEPLETRAFDPSFEYHATINGNLQTVDNLNDGRIIVKEV